MIIELLTAEQLTDAIQQQVADLYRQLNKANKQSPLSEVLETSNKVLVAICRVDESIVGIALLSTYKVISGYRGLVEDVDDNPACELVSGTATGTCRQTLSSLRSRGEKVAEKLGTVAGFGKYTEKNVAVIVGHGDDPFCIGEEAVVGAL